MLWQCGALVDGDLRRLLCSFPGAVWVADEQLCVIELLGADLDGLGIDPAAARGKTIAELLGDAAEPALEAHRAALAGIGGSYDLSYRGVRRRSRVEPVHDDEGVVRGVIGLSFDASATLVAERKLGEYAAIVRSSADAIIAKTLDGIVTSWNGGAERIYGYSAEEMIGKPIETIVPPEGRDELRAIHERAAAGEVTENLITTRVRKDGTRITVAISVSPTFAPDGTLYGASTIGRDITEALRTRTALAETEALTRSVIDSALDAVVVVDAEGVILEFNATAVTMFGIAAAEAIGREVVDVIVPPASRERHRHGFARYLATGDGRIIGRPVEMTGMRADGTEFPVELTITEVPGLGRTVFTGFIRDITERKRAEEGLQHLATIVETTDDAIVTRTVEGSILSWNPGAERLFGFAASEALGRDLNSLLRVEETEELEKARAQVARGERVRPFTGRVRHKGGREIVVSTALSPIVDSADRVVAETASMRDVTELRRVHKALERSEASYRLLFEQHPTPMWLFDPETLRFLAVNESAVALYGYSQSEFLAMTIEEIRPAEDVEALQEATSDRARVRVGPRPWRHRKKDGTLINVEIESNNVEFEGRTVRLVLARDITEQHRLEQQLRQAQKMDAIGNLAGGIAHDFNNILLVIRGLSGILLNQLDGDSKKRVFEIDVAAQRAAEVTRQLLAFSRQQILKPETVDLNGVVAETLTMLSRLIDEDIEIVDQLSPQLPSVVVDRSQLQQVVLNLLVNARDAIDAGGRITVRTGSAELDEHYAAEHLEVDPGSYVILEVTDTGRGMDEETRNRVFDPFFTTKETGTGLGLATVFGILKQSGGHIAVYSEPDIGTTFRVYLPQARQPSAGTTQIAAARGAEDLSGHETILVVEDADAVRQLVIELLGAQGYEVVAARRGDEAIELVQSGQRSVDLVLTDVVMPGMNGRELADRLSADAPELKVLFTSGYPADTVVRHGISEARVAFIQKPYSTIELLRAVRGALDAPTGVGPRS